MMAMPRRMVPRTQASIMRGVGPYRSAEVSHRAPTRSSIRMYCGEMGSPHHRHRPRSTSHDTTGMLSYQAISRWHRGHDDGGRMSERALASSLGSRRMQTFRKLPKISPKSAATTRKKASPPTQHLVEENARRHGDVEGL